MPPDEIDRADDVSVTPAPAPKKRVKKKKKPRTADGAPAATSATARRTSAGAKAKRTATEGVTATSGMPRGVRYGLVGGGLAACVGITLVATSPSVVGTWLVVASIVTLVASIHRLGRLGPEGLA